MWARFSHKGLTYSQGAHDWVLLTQGHSHQSRNAGREEEISEGPGGKEVLRRPWWEELLKENKGARARGREVTGNNGDRKQLCFAESQDELVWV